MSVIGLTYDLRSYYLSCGYTEEETAEFDRDDTIDAIEAALHSLGHDVVRIGNARQLITQLVQGHRWDLVFNLCEGLTGAARESQVPCILDLYDIPYTFADPGVMALCLNKAWSKAVIQRAGVRTADFTVVTQQQDVADTGLDFPLFVKPIGEGTGKGIASDSIVRTPDQLAQKCAEMLDRFQQPVLVESFLPGREFTVCLTGTGTDARVLGTLEIVLLQNAEPDVYSYLNKEECEQRVEYVFVHPEPGGIVQDVEQSALIAWRALGCRDAGRIDFRADAAGQACFLEANPLAGLHPEHSDLPMLATARGMSFNSLIEEIINSASKRLVRKTDAEQPEPINGMADARSNSL